MKPTVFVRRTLNEKGCCKIRVFGCSMAPVILDGDVVEIVRYPFNELAPGCIIAFEHDERLIIHRIRYRCAEVVITAGDANILCDPVVASKDYIGLVARRYRRNEPELLLLSTGVSARKDRLAPLYTVWLPAGSSISTNEGESTRKFGSFSIRILEADSLPAFSPHNAIGLSARGLLDEIQFLNAIEQGIYNIVCCANFGPDGGNWLPVNSLHGVARISVFDHIGVGESPNPEQRIHLLNYLDGLITAATLLGRKGRSYA
ncbi:S24 family peptidase [Meiothermus taiwanensis]|uniref:S24 family peptidase n=1 Tax=Meiothermus taiwanensis TaxID=172827 RepID=UPI000E651478|nr:S24 family peptidase [Meiothermus taiwanensis]GIW31273.1 MAG: hypothetical protein KatS3mg071_1447 [Meiothermus sp.]